MEKKSEHTFITEQLPFATMKDIDKECVLQNDMIPYSSITKYNNVLVRKYVADESMPYMTDEEKEQHSIFAIYTECYEFTSNNALPQKLFSELIKSNTSGFKLTKYNSEYFDEVYFCCFFLNGEKATYLYYRNGNVVVHTQIFSEKNCSIEYIVHAIELC